MQMIKKILLAALIWVALNSVAFASTDLTIINQTGKTITQIYLSPTDEPEEWIMQSANFLRDGESVTLVINPKQFTPRPRLRYFNIGVNYDDFTQETWFGLDIFNLSKIRLYVEGHDVAWRN